MSGWRAGERARIRNANKRRSPSASTLIWRTAMFFRQELPRQVEPSRCLPRASTSFNRNSTAINTDLWKFVVLPSRFNLRSCMRTKLLTKCSRSSGTTDTFNGSVARIFELFARRIVSLKKGGSVAKKI